MKTPDGLIASACSGLDINVLKNSVEGLVHHLVALWRDEVFGSSSC